MTVSTATRGALQAVNDADGVLMLVRIDNAAFSANIRLVNDTRDWTIGADTYLGCPVRITLPQDVSKEVPRARLEIDNVGRDVTAELELLPPGESLLATIRLVHRSTPTVVDWEFTAPLSNFHTNTLSVSAVMGPDDVMRRPAVALRFDQRSAPGLIPG